MIICHCHGVSDRELRAAARRGESCADVARGCRAGSACHGCLPAVREILRENVVRELSRPKLEERQ
ncbi:MAG: (2Fe-2S)-binding protein [Planctomycetes bacterium]|nr:(2Fe-2S)-binding protein [Planctomycetota bacterium]MCB9903179.1 (2Fe-2S)-binding protein [Planctomycetota bacterium]